MYVQVAEERPTARPVHRTNHSNNNAGNNDPMYVWRTDNGSSGPELNDASFYLSAKSSCSDKRNNANMQCTLQSRAATASPDRKQDCYQAAFFLVAADCTKQVLEQIGQRAGELCFM
jgi:hypothetical protein